MATRIEQFAAKCRDALTAQPGPPGGSGFANWCRKC